MSKIGLMGGTFNPIHVGHILLAQYAYEEFELDEVWFLPTGVSYLKANMNVLDGNTRCEMVELAVKKHKDMFVNRIEIDREGSTYTCDTLIQLKKEYPQHEFYFIFGADCLFSIENWYQPQLIMENCTIIAALRSGSDIESMEVKKEYLCHKFGAKILLLPFIQLELSSTLIRKRVHEGKSIQYMVPPEVEEYIIQNHLYQ